MREAVLDGLPDADAEAARAPARPRTPAASRRSCTTSAATTSATSSARSRAARATADRPTVIFAYTIKGYGLEIAGRPQNHSALLTAEQIDELRARSGLTPESEWDRVPGGVAGGAVCSRRRARRLERRDRSPAAHVEVPRTLSTRDPATISTQAAFGRTLLDLSRVEGVGERLVTVSPDVSVSTNLGGFINKIGVWGHAEEPVYDLMDDSPLKWRVGPRGPAHRDGHRRDEPRAAPRPARPQLGLPARAAVSDRDGLRPLRDAGARGNRLLDVLRLPLRPGRHAVRDLALARRWRPPVVEHSGDRDRRRPASATPSRATRGSSNGCCSTAWRGCRSRTARRCTSASRRRRSTRRLSPRRRPGSATSGFGRMSSPAVSASVSRAGGRPDRPRDLRRDRAAGARGGDAACRRGRRRGHRALPLLARSSLPRLAVAAARSR